MCYPCTQRVRLSLSYQPLANVNKNSDPPILNFESAHDQVADLGQQLSFQVAVEAPQKSQRGRRRSSIIDWRRDELIAGRTTSARTSDQALGHPL